MNEKGYIDGLPNQRLCESPSVTSRFELYCNEPQRRHILGSTILAAISKEMHLTRKRIYVKADRKV